MAEERSKKSKRSLPPPSKGKINRNYKEETEEPEDVDDFRSMSQRQKDSDLTEELNAPQTKKQAKKEAPPTKSRKSKGDRPPSASSPLFETNSSPAGNEYLLDSKMQEKQTAHFPKSFTPLPPITSTQNFNEIFQTKLQSRTMIAFRDYFLEHAKLTGTLECDANAFLTDAHLYELSQLDWPYLETIRIRACPHLTPFALNYVQAISNKTNNRQINTNIELMLQAHGSIQDTNLFNDNIASKLEQVLGKCTKTSIAKVLIYHANAPNDSLLSAQQMIISQMQKSKENSTMLLDYFSSTYEECQVALLECTHFILFKELASAFHPQVIYMVVSTVDELLKVFFSVDCNVSFSILQNQQIRLIISAKQSEEQFLSGIQSQLKNISTSARELYSQTMKTELDTVSDDHQFRCNQSLSSLLYLQSKCDLLQKKLSKDECLVFKQNDTSLLSNSLIKDAVKHCKSYHTFSSDPSTDTKEGENKVFQTNEPMTKLIKELTTSAKGQGLDEATQNSIRTVQVYFAQKFTNGPVLDLFSMSNEHSYVVSDIEWFCQKMNNLFTTEMSHHRKTEQILEKLQRAIGTNIHMISKRDFRRLKLNKDEMHFFQWLFNSWNIAYPVSIHEQNDNSIYVLLNSIPVQPPVPLSMVWGESGEDYECQSTVNFHLLHACDGSILFQLFKLFPSQKILLASKDFILIQEGAMEILLQYRQPTNENTDITVTFRALLILPSDQLFHYILREYYMLIWAFLIKHDYGFQINEKHRQNSKPSLWDGLPLYHYTSTPTLTSPCSVCGLRPTANKSLYDAFTILSPALDTRENALDTAQITQPGLLSLELDSPSFSYIAKHSIRPDGCNSFEVMFLCPSKETDSSQSSVLALIQIGCLMNSFDIKETEKILFDYGVERHTQSKTQDLPKPQAASQGSYLDEIRSFGGLKGLKATKDKSSRKSELQELYTGLRLRIDIFYTHKPNTYELVFSINNIPWSRQTIKRKSTQTVFQPIIQSSVIHKNDQKINVIIRHHITALDKASIQPPSSQDSVKSPWKVGMRLEAKDRKNPNILAIANIIEVYEDNRVRINFDGWTSTFDYTVEIDSADLHPCGYGEYVQRVLHKNVDTRDWKAHFTFSRFDPPKSYSGPFSWRNYLIEKDQQPVPFECFNYLQTEGMTVEYFPHGITKADVACLSCRHFYNVRVKYQKMNTFIQDEITNKILYEHHWESSSPTAVTCPGAVLLPTPFPVSMLAYPCLKQFQDPSNFRVHTTCNHRSISPLDSETIISGTHLMDYEGTVISKTSFNLSLATLCMLTAVDLARNQKRPIAPSTSQLISDVNDSSIDKHLIDAFIRSWLELSAYITCCYSRDFYTKDALASTASSTSFYTIYSDRDLFSNLKKNLTSVPLISRVPWNTKKETSFGTYGECFYCNLFRNDESKDRAELPLNKRLNFIGDYAPSIFYLELYKQEKSMLTDRLILNDEFFLQFNGLEIIDVTNIIIDRFQLNKKNISSLKNLTYLSLENNDLPMIHLDFQYLPRLTYMKLSQNPFEALPVNCLACKSLQQVNLFGLGRLNEIDPNMRFSSELKSLSITDSILTTLPQTLGTDARTKLTKLTLSGVAWWGVEGMSVNEVIKYESFEKKFLSVLNSQDLSAIYNMYDEDANGVLSFSEINAMNAHIYRYVSRLRSSNVKIPNSGRSSTEPANTNESDVSKQESFVGNSSGIPSAIFYLENLTELTLEYQGIKTVPDAIKTLKNLTILNLNYCIELETLSAQIGFLPLRELNLNGCVSLKTPPAEITRRGHSQTMAFLQRLVSGSTSCKRTKLMLVGLGGAGKTSLVRAFLESHASTPPTVTDGIDILKWKVPLNEPDDFLEFSVWDFAGQSVYYHTHQFFLAKKAVYILAWNIRLGAEHAGLDFWLSSICCHAPNAPIFVVGTHSDQVSRIDLRQDDLKRRYPQIAGFFNVSTYTGDNVSDLIENIIKTTLALPYMDEQIPKAWLNFEELISVCGEDILQYHGVEDIAHNAGIFESDEVLQAVQFLHDLGSLQYFSSEYLKNYVVINSQWIVNVMACIVSIKDSPVKNGRLYHSDIGVIWGDYSENLHPWILKLTEAFDLTFPVPDQNMNLVPCLLPEEEPEYTWNDDVTETDIREMKIIYTFNYLPAGLFNRAQVRLFQFSDKSTIWRYGSLLVKNNHRAVIIRTDDRHIVIKIQGVRPDNILFLVHEVFEGLVNESFFGVTYDIAFPCPDCVELRTNEPWQFSSSLINRAIELKSPSIQCHRFFHVASVTDLQALIPPDSKSNYDLHLEYSVRDLKSYKQNMAVDIVYIYPSGHIPTASEMSEKVDPRKIKEDLSKRGLKIWAPESMKDFKIENHYLVVKEAASILFGISTELVEDFENRNLYDAFRTIVNILRKPVIPLLFGTDMKWKESDIGVALTDTLYVNMQSPKRYDQRIIDLVDMIEQGKGGKNNIQQLRDQPTDIFISYCWANSHDAVGKGTKPTATSIGWGDPRGLKDYLEGRGLSIWLDITRLGKSGVLHDIVHGLKNTRLVIACVSDEYTQSEVCRNEFLFAKNTLRIPVILAIYGSGDKWRTTEVGMCSLTCPQVNFQYENPAAFEDLYSHIQSNLPKRPTSAKVTVPNGSTTTITEEKTTAAYQELFELTQRKFLRLTAGFADSMTTRNYARLFALDYMGEKEKSAQELGRIEMATQMNAQRSQKQENEEDNERDREAERQRDEEVRRKEQEAETANAKEKEIVKERTKSLCIRLLCENEENWHPTGCPFEVMGQAMLQNSASYLTRIMLLLKQSDLGLEILTSGEGERELQKLTDTANTMGMEVKDSYAYLRRCIMDCDLEEKFSGLKQCLMPSGKVLWLCEEHQNQPRVVVITDSVTGTYNRPQVEEKSEIVKALVKLNDRIANNELPVPSLSVPSVENVRRSSVDKQSSSSRSSRRFSRQESILIKAQQQNILEADEKIEENDNADVQTLANGGENQNHEEESAAVSTDCSIM